MNLLGIVSKRASRILLPTEEVVDGSHQLASLLNTVCYFRYVHTYDSSYLRSRLVLQLMCLQAEAHDVPYPASAVAATCQGSAARRVRTQSMPFTGVQVSTRCTMQGRGADRWRDAVEGC